VCVCALNFHNMFVRVIEKNYYVSHATTEDIVFLETFSFH